MTNNDFFVEEVNSDVRDERFSKQFRKYRWVLLAIILGVIGFVSFSEIRSSQVKTSGEAQYDLLKASLETSEVDPNALLEYPEPLANLEGARALEISGNTEGAEAHYDQMVNSSAYSHIDRDLANLQLLSLQKDGAALLGMEEDVFAIHARLRVADDLLLEGKDEEALELLQALAVEDLMAGERELVVSLIHALGGEIPVEEIISSGAEHALEADNGEL